MGFKFVLVLTFVAIQSGNGQTPEPQRFSALKEAGLTEHVSLWGYGEHELGSRFWPVIFPQTCSGIHQSPIDIKTSDTVYDPTLSDFSLFYDPPSEGSTFEMHNNGHARPRFWPMKFHAIEINTKGLFFLTNGGLLGVYRTEQFHFHWGRNDSAGSEHTINGERYPLELHIVNWNSVYGSLKAAGKRPNGLAVLSVLFEISKDDNPFLEPIVQKLPLVVDPDQHFLVGLPVEPLRKFLPRKRDRYYRYSGSLTTPSCSETVVWTVFEQKQTISERQLYGFKQMLTSSHHIMNRPGRRPFGEFDGGILSRDILVDNFRPVNPLNDRVVYRSFSDHPGTSAGQRKLYICEGPSGPADQYHPVGELQLGFQMNITLNNP